MVEYEEKQCPGCMACYTKKTIQNMIDDPIESELGASWECWIKCFYCGTPLTKVMSYEEAVKHTPDPECEKLRSEKTALIRKKYKELEQTREQARKEEEQRIHHNGYKCPNCGKYGGRKISVSSRVVGLATLGVLSSNVGKTYKCKHCGYKW